VNTPADRFAGLSDLQLADRVTQRHHDALEEIYRRHAYSVGAVARMVLGRWAGCEDVVADVFLAYWLQPEGFDPERGSLVGYLRLKARGLSLDTVRAEVARRRREENHSRTKVWRPNDIDEGLLTSEAAEQMRRAVASLHDREREPIELAFFTDMTYTDVAVHLRLPEGTVKSRIRTGLRHMKVIVEHQLLAAESEALAHAVAPARRRPVESFPLRHSL
jgi:RNA polymerase sigma-70 factor (ECF subfamily)